ncbi:MAG: hypothetical protein JSR39_02175 [Verrucomicrobia bacterium]|nr:hypothetical protein [Verrucomicrobiota bacterium]
MTSTIATPFEPVNVENPLLFLSEMLNKFSDGQMIETTVESQTIMLLTNCESHLSTDEMNELNGYAAQMQSMIDYGNSNPGWLTKQTQQDKMTELNTDFSTAMQEGSINTQDIQGFVQAFQTAMQLVMSGLQSMSSMYDSISSSESFVSSLIAN